MAKSKKKPIQVEIEADAPKGQLEKLGIADKDALAAQISRDFSDSELIKYQWIPERNEDVKAYFGVIKAAEWPFKGASRIKSQFQRIVVDTLSGNLIKSLFLPECPIEPKPAPLGKDSSDETLDNIRYVRDLHNSLAFNEYNLKSVLDKAVPTSLIESFCVLHPVYEYLINEILVDVTRYVAKDVDASSLTYDLDTDSVITKDGQNVPAIDPENYKEEMDEGQLGQMQEVNFTVTKEECIKDGISIKVINGYRFHIPVTSPGETPYDKVQTAPSAMHQLFYTVREFEQYRDIGYFENVDPKIDDLFDPQRELISYTKLVEAGFVKDVAQVQTPYINVLKWCGKWKINGKWRELIVWKDKNSNTILRAEPNIFGVRPYFPIVLFPIDETPYGESLCKIIRPLVKEIDLLMRIITNIALMKSAPPKFYDPASGFNPATVGQFGPNSWIPAREPGRNVFVPPSPEDPQIAFQMLNFIVNIVERITGVNEVVQGQIANRANTTATEVQQALVRSGVRFDTIYERLKEQLKPMFKYIHKLTLRNMPDTKEIRLMGAENAGRLVKIHKAMLQGQYEFDLVGNSVMAESAELQNAMTLYNSVGQHPYLSYKPESIYYMLYNIVKRLNPVAMSKILPTPDEVKQLERQRAQVQGQQEQQAAQQAQQSQVSQGQAQQMAMQMEAATKKQQMTLDENKAQMDMQMRQMEFQQKMKHNEETHQAKLQHLKELANVKAKEASKPQGPHS